MRAHLDVTANQVGDEFRIGGSPRSATPDVIGNVVDLSRTSPQNSINFKLFQRIQYDSELG